MVELLVLRTVGVDLIAVLHDVVEARIVLAVQVYYLDTIHIGRLALAAQLTVEHVVGLFIAFGKFGCVDFEFCDRFRDGLSTFQA